MRRRFTRWLRAYKKHPYLLGMGLVYVLVLHPLVLTPLVWWLDKKYGQAIYEAALRKLEEASP
jgi:hypothetical protein